jgi:DNA-binding beta-propeller fold protein YncE
VFLSYGSRVVEDIPAGSSYSQLTVDENLGSPTGLAVDSNGNLYVADFKTRLSG